MTAVMRLAEARRKASISSSSSIRLSLGGVQMDCMTKQSPPRTFSRISTITSPSGKRPTSALPKRTPNSAQTSRASAGLELPVNIFSSSLARSGIDCFDLFLRLAPRPTTIFCVGAGREGFEPSNARSKAWCLTSLATAQLDPGLLRDRAHTCYQKVTHTITPVPAVPIDRESEQRKWSRMTAFEQSGVIAADVKAGLKPCQLCSLAYINKRAK